MMHVQQVDFVDPCAPVIIKNLNIIISQEVKIHLMSIIPNRHHISAMFVQKLYLFQQRQFHVLFFCHLHLVLLIDNAIINRIATNLPMIYKL